MSDRKLDALAIVGMGCRFPGVISAADGFWRFFGEGRHGITEVPANRWAMERFYDLENRKPGMAGVRHGGFFSEDIGVFDASFSSTPSR